MGKIPKSAPSTVHRKIICDNFGVDKSRLKDFCLDDFTLEQQISILLGIQLGLEQKPINPKSVRLLYSNFTKSEDHSEPI